MLTYADLPGGRWRCRIWGRGPCRSAAVTRDCSFSLLRALARSGFPLLSPPPSPQFDPFSPNFLFINNCIMKWLALLVLYLFFSGSTLLHLESRSLKWELRAAICLWGSKRLCEGERQKKKESERERERKRERERDRHFHIYIERECVCMYVCVFLST